MIKIIVLVFIIAILISLGSALIGLLKGGESGSDKMFKSLTIRIGLSLFLFMGLMFAGFMGWIEPHNISPIG